MSNIKIRIFLGIILSILSAILIVLSFAPFNISFLILVSFVPMIISQYHLFPQNLSSIAKGITIGGFLFGYLYGLFSGFGPQAWYMKYLPIIIGILTVFTDKNLRRSDEKTGFKYFILDGVFSWVGIELIRTFIPAFGTWAFLSYAFYNQPWFIQPVKIFGIFGLGIIIMLINYAIGFLVIKILNNKLKLNKELDFVPMGFVKKWFVASLIILISWSILSFSLFKKPEGEKVKVGIVQTNPFDMISLNNLWKGNYTKEEFENFKKEGLNRLIEDTKIASNLGAKIIVWPEGALSFDPKIENSKIFINLSKETDSYLVIPYGVKEERGYRNEVTILSPDGKFLGVFGKDHPVVFTGETSLTRGTYPVYKTEFGNLGTIICYDLDFTDTARKVARNGAQILLIPSADWPEIAYKHYTHAIFRAVENNVSIVKSEWAFDSCFIDPYGRIINKSVNPVSERKILVEEIPLGTGRTVQVFLGDYIGWASLFGMILIMIIKGRKVKKNV
jgi:apolipoprotein N-acyltransferase